jgi:hypothetical protein
MPEDDEERCKGEESWESNATPSPAESGEGWRWIGKMGFSILFWVAQAREPALRR